MEYGIKLCNDLDVKEYNNMRHVGWKQTLTDCADCYKALFEQSTVDIISKKVTELTLGIDKENRPIVVPDGTIYSVLSDVFTNFRPEVGDIYSRYNIPNGAGPRNDAQHMIDETIEIITSHIKNDLGMKQHNESLSIWSTVYGEFNENGLRRHAPIKVRRKNTNHRGMVSFMNY